MKPGERQVAPTLAGIRADHRLRYEFAAALLPAGARVIDFACGVGYGAHIMAGAGHLVQAYDIDQEALDYALQHYAHERVVWTKRNGNDPESLPEVDCAVCFETIEHIEDPRPLLKSLREASPMLIASVPNEEVFPWQRADGAVTAYHFRHYTKFQFADLLRECGWCPTEWHGQEGPESEVAPAVNGRTLIAVCTRDVLPEEQAHGRHICIVGLGPSCEQYVDQVKRLGGRRAFCDEVWAINALGNVLDCDLIFHMDDIRIQEIRAKAAPASNIAQMVQWLKTSKVPVVTSRKHPDYPALVDFPLEEVLNHLGHDYFNSTAAYAVAMAIHVGATEISCFGMDFTYPNAHQAEKGRACVEFWLGQAHARGIKVSLPKKTTLMDACTSRMERLYGYDTLDVKFHIQGDGELKLEFVPLE
ncbi:MAG: methyltransferase domain-containing protein, partial [Roseovarius sp.]